MQIAVFLPRKLEGRHPLGLKVGGASAPAAPAVPGPMPLTVLTLILFTNNYCPVPTPKLVFRPTNPRLQPTTTDRNVTALQGVLPSDRASPLHCHLLAAHRTHSLGNTHSRPTVHNFISTRLSIRQSSQCPNSVKSELDVT